MKIVQSCRLVQHSVVLAALIFFGAACGSPEGASGLSVSGVTTTAAPTTTEVPAPEFPLAIISLSPTATEILFAIGAGDQVVAVDDQSTYPTDAPMSDLSGFTPNVEAIAEYNPDLVIISYDPGDLVSGLEALGITVLSQSAAYSIDDTYVQIVELGDLTGHVDEATALNTEIKAGLAALAESQVGAGLAYFHEIDSTLYTATSATFVGQLYALLGLENIADPADEEGWGYPQLSPEYILDADPDIIFLNDAQWGESVETLAARPAWGSLSAVINGHVIDLDETAGRWGPRVVDFLTGVASALEGLAAE